MFVQQNKFSIFLFLNIINSFCVKRLYSLNNIKRGKMRSNLLNNDVGTYRLLSTLIASTYYQMDSAVTDLFYGTLVFP